MPVRITIPVRTRGITIYREKAAPETVPYEFEPFDAEPSATPKEQPTEPPSPPTITLTEEELKAQLKAAYDQGFNDGREVASRTLEREIQTAMEHVRSVDNLLLSIQQQFQKLQTEFEKAVAELAIAIAETILQEKLQDHHIELIIRQIRAVFQEFPVFEELTIRLNPQDIEALQQAQSQLFAPGEVRNITLIPDERIERGGCIIETPLGAIDAQLSTQLEQIRLQLQRAVSPS